MCWKSIFSKKDKIMARPQGSDQSPYSHFAVDGNGKLFFSIVAVTDGGYTHSDEKVNPLIPGEVELLGLYHYLRSGVPIQEQIKVFDEAIKNWEWDFLAVDFEKIHNEHLDGDFAAMAKKFIDEFIEAYEKPVLLYTSPSIIQEWMLPFGHTWYQAYDLWISQWPYNELVSGPQSVLKEVPLLPEKWNPRLPAGATNWRVWQYSAGGNNRAAEFGATGNSSLDLCVFNGTAEDMISWAKKEEILPPPANCDDQIAHAVAENSLRYETQIEEIKAIHEDELKDAIIEANNGALNNLIKNHLM